MKSVKEFFKAFQETDENSGIMADEMCESAPAIPTGSIALDDVIGCGGFPCGRITQIYGPSGGGKTFLCMIGIKNAQLADPTAEQVWFDAEGTFNSAWAEKLGLDISKIAIIPPEIAQSGRDSFEFLLGIPKEDAKTHALIGKKKDGLIDEIANKELNINFCVYDSLGALIAPGEDIADVGKMNIALLSRFLSKEMKRLSLEVNKSKIPFVFINHKKATMDMWASSDHTFSGGNSYTHFLSLNVYVEAIMRKDSMLIDEKERKIGHKMRATVEKTKFGPWPRKCEFDADFTQGIVNVENELVALGIEHDLIIKPTNQTYEIGDKKWRGADNLIAEVKTNVELQKILRDGIYDVWKKRSELKKNKSNLDVESVAPKKSKKKKGDEE